MQMNRNELIDAMTDAISESLRLAEDSRHKAFYLNRVELYRLLKKEALDKRGKEWTITITT